MEIRLNLDKNKFLEEGFFEIKNFFKKKELIDIKKRYKKIFEGNYSTGVVPDKIKWVKGRDKNNIPRSLCNVWKSDKSVAKVVLSKKLGKAVAYFGGWKSSRLNQDSLIWVVPNAGTVAFHQDNPYQDWHEPGGVITAWIPLEDTKKDGGTLEYLIGSHKKGLSGRLDKFYSNKEYRNISKKSLKNSKDYKRHFVCLKAGSLCLHHGNMWHGSGYNKTKKNRISLSIHFMDGKSKFHTKKKSPYFNHYKFVGSTKMSEDFFPITWSKSKNKKYFINKYLK